eukprot:sb/3470088/
MSSELEWLLSAEMPLAFSSISERFSKFSSLLQYCDHVEDQDKTSPFEETIPLSSTLRDDHVKGHIKMRGPLITKTELSIEINNTPVPVKTVACIREDEKTPWRLFQLGHAANYLYLARTKCQTIAGGGVSNAREATDTINEILDHIKRCKLQFVLPTPEINCQNYAAFCPELPPGLIVNFHIKDIKLVLTISCLKNPQDLHVKERQCISTAAN